MQAEFEAAFHLTFFLVELIGRDEAGELRDQEQGSAAPADARSSSSPPRSSAWPWSARRWNASAARATSKTPACRCCCATARCSRSGRARPTCSRSTRCGRSAAAFQPGGFRQQTVATGVLHHGAALRGACTAGRAGLLACRALGRDGAAAGPGDRGGRGAPLRPHPGSRACLSAAGPSRAVVPRDAATSVRLPPPCGSARAGV